MNSNSKKRYTSLSHWINTPSLFFVCVSLAQGGPGHKLSGPSPSVGEEGAEFLPGGLSPPQSQLPSQPSRCWIKAFLFCWHAALLESPSSWFVRRGRSQVYSFSVGGREAGFRAPYCLRCVTSFMPSVWLLALVRLVIWGTFQRWLWQQSLSFSSSVSPLFLLH